MAAVAGVATRLCGVLNEKLGWLDRVHAFAAVLALFLIAILANRLLGVYWRQYWTNPLRYPPTSVAVFVALAIVWFVERLQLVNPSPTASGADWACVFGAELGAVGVLVAVSFGRWVLVDRPKDSQRSLDPRGRGDIATNPEALLAWIDTTRPVERTEDDWFGATPIASRFAERVLRELHQPCTIGLRGAYGSGKSTVVRLMREQFERAQHSTRPKVVLCEVDCWGFDAAGSALEHILGEIVRHVNRHVDSLALRGLPDAYHKAVSSEKWTWTFLLELFTGNRGAGIDRLRDLAPLLRATNIRLVLVVENLDRPRAGKFDPQEILALLNRLRDAAPELSYVLTGGVGTETIDLANLFNHIESLPPLDPDRVRTVLRTFVSACLGQYSAIDPRSDDYAKRVIQEIGLGEPSDPSLSYFLGQEDTSLVLTVLPLFATPRTLKLVLG